MRGFPKMPKTPKAPTYKPFVYKEPKLAKEPSQPHTMTMYEKALIDFLKPAIMAKHVIKFWYEDSENNISDWRIVEPNLIGQTKFQTAKIWLSAWFMPTQKQIMDGHFPDWKTYILDNVKKLEILEQTFRCTRPNYNPDDRRMKTIFCRTLRCIL